MAPQVDAAFERVIGEVGGDGGYRGGKAACGSGCLRDVGVSECQGDLGGHGLGAGRLPAQAQEADFGAVGLVIGGCGRSVAAFPEPAGLVVESEFVENGDLVSGAGFRSVGVRVFELLAGHQAAFVAQEAVVGNPLRVELDLCLHVASDGAEVLMNVGDEELAGFGKGVHVGGDAAALLGQLLHEAVSQVAVSKAQDVEKDAVVGVVVEELYEHAWVGDADVEEECQKAWGGAAFIMGLVGAAAGESPRTFDAPKRLLTEIHESIDYQRTIYYGCGYAITEICMLS